MAIENPAVFNAYQETQEPKVEKQMAKAAHVAAFVGLPGGKTLFVGIYKVRGAETVPVDELSKIPEQIELTKYGVTFPTERTHIQLFDLELTPILAEQRGKLTVKWDNPIAWSRWAGKNTFEIEDFVDHSASGQNLSQEGARNFGDDNQQVSEDVVEILEKESDSTTRKALVDARLGQGKFREQVLALWGNQCAVTGATTREAIRASHIIPWCVSVEKRLDPQNGLPLVANLDALFDRGLISFDASGQMIVSPVLSTTERELLQLDQQKLSKSPTPETAAYLAHHRERFFGK